MDRVGHGHDHPAAGSEESIYQGSRSGDHFFWRAVREEVLYINTRHEGDTVTESLRGRLWVHSVWLDRMEHIQTDLDQVAYDGCHVAAGMEPELHAV